MSAGAVVSGVKNVNLSSFPIVVVAVILFTDFPFNELQSTYLLPNEKQRRHYERVCEPRGW